jgi:hypothetical protein
MPCELDSEIRSRLIRYYQQVSDNELLEAAVKAEDLTPTAQEVVHTELESRGLGHAWVNPKDAPESRVASSELPAPLRESWRDALPTLQPGLPIERGKTALITFYDAIEAGNACDALDEAEIGLEVKDLSQTEGRGSFYGGSPIALQLIVNEQDRGRAVKLLRDKMGLFPLEDIAEPDTPVDDGTIATVGQFANRADAEEVSRVLTAAKIWNRITANPDGSAATEDAFLVEVREVDLIGAGELVEKALNLPEA